MKKYVLSILLLSCAAAYSQSPLALQYPLGLPDVPVAGQSAAMGGSGIAVAEEYFGAGINPANAAIGKRSAFSALVTFERTVIHDDGETSSMSRYAPKLMSLVLPLGAAGNLSFGMQRRFDANLNYYTQEVKRLNDYVTYTNTIELQNIGGMTAWQAGWAYRLKNGLSAGISYERLYYNFDSRNDFESIFSYNLYTISNVSGKSDTSWTPTSYRTFTRELTTADFASDGIRFGMQVPVHEKFTLAAAAEYIFESKGGNIRSEYKRHEDASQNGVMLGSDKDKFKIHLPPSMNIGAAYTPDDRWLIAVDAQTTLWENYDNDAPNMFGDPGDLRRTYGVAAGGRFIPAISRLSAKYWEKVLYSAGIKYNTLPVDGADEFGFSIGAGLPIPNDGGVVDLVFEYGIRSDSRYDKYNENTMKFHLGINGGRNWFQDAARR